MQHGKYLRVDSFPIIQTTPMGDIGVNIDYKISFSHNHRTPLNMLMDEDVGIRKWKMTKSWRHTKFV